MTIAAGITNDDRGREGECPHEPVRAGEPRLVRTLALPRHLLLIHAFAGMRMGEHMLEGKSCVIE
jgi:hypothetical protein